MIDSTLVNVIGAHFRERPAHPAQRHKRGGRWTDISYGEMGAAVREVAAGLRALGLQNGDRVSLLSVNRVEWAWSDLGVLFAGGVTATIYPNSVPREVAYIVANSESRFIFVEDASQLEKILAVRAETPTLQRAILIAGSPGDAEFTLSLDALREMGRQALAREAGLLDGAAKDIGNGDLAAIIYTSGTTGPPKGVMLSHRNILFVLDTISKVIPDFEEFDLNLSFLPLSHALERIGGHFLPLAYGRTIGYAESLEKVGDGFREVRPDIAVAVPRVFEKVYARINDQLKDAPALRRRIFQWAVGVGREVVQLRSARQPIPGWLALRHRLADRLVYAKIREAVGGRMRYFVSGGAPLSTTIAEFFCAVGVMVLEGWGATETAAPATLTLPGDYAIGSVGRPLPGVEVTVAADGELFIRGPNVCMGYWKMPEQSAETFDADGWYHTGDVGRIDERGFVYITDRKKELIITSAGKNISPQNIENRLKLSPYIANAMAIGDRRNYVTALITLDVDAVNKRLRLEGLDHAALAARADVQALIGGEVETVNADLPRFEQVRKFRVTPADFAVEQDELSASLKLKRRNITAHCQPLIDEMYEG
jgi:long-chain acyl-CoA synthetase